MTATTAAAHKPFTFNPASLGTFPKLTANALQQKAFGLFLAGANKNTSEVSKADKIKYLDAYCAAHPQSSKYYCTDKMGSPVDQERQNLLNKIVLQNYDKLKRGNIWQDFYDKLDDPAKVGQLDLNGKKPSSFLGVYAMASAEKKKRDEYRGYGLTGAIGGLIVGCGLGLLATKGHSAGAIIGLIAGAVGGGFAGIHFDEMHFIKDFQSKEGLQYLSDEVLRNETIESSYQDLANEEHNREIDAAAQPAK